MDVLIGLIALIGFTIYVFIFIPLAYVTLRMIFWFLDMMRVENPFVTIYEKIREVFSNDKPDP